MDEKRVDNTSNLTKLNSLLSLSFKNLKELEKCLKADAVFEQQFLSKYCDVEILLRPLKADERKEYLKSAKEFILEGLKQMWDRIPFRDEILNSCSATHLTSFDKDKWITLDDKFSNIITSELKAKFTHEVDHLEYNYLDLLAQKDWAGGIVHFWTTMQSEYPILSKLALSVQTLPYSTACVERTFSVPRDIKKPKRNRLSSESLEACLLIQHELEGINDLFMTPEMIENYKTMWKSHDDEEHDSEVPEKDRIATEKLVEKSNDDTMGEEKPVVQLKKGRSLDSVNPPEYAQKNGHKRSAVDSLPREDLEKEQVDDVEI